MFGAYKFSFTGLSCTVPVMGLKSLFFSFTHAVCASVYVCKIRDGDSCDGCESVPLWIILDYS